MRITMFPKDNSKPLDIIEFNTTDDVEFEIPTIGDKFRFNGTLFIVTDRVFDFVEKKNLSYVQTCSIWMETV